jgi:hypothetical protein
MTRGLTITLAGAALALGIAEARGDDWDVNNETDGGSFTDNALLHGAQQDHDLAAFNGVPDQDWFLVAARARSSYQIVVDGVTERLDLESTDVQRLLSTDVLAEDALVTDGGGVLSLQWQTTVADNNLVRVRGAACGPICNSGDRYRIRFYETTYTLPRFNNSGTQSTVLVIQNATDRSCSVTHNYLSAAGSGLGTVGPTTIPARGLQVFATATVLPGQSGSVRITHDCGYGGLSGKAVALEPATGFTFDTPLVARPN